MVNDPRTSGGRWSLTFSIIFRIGRYDISDAAPIVMAARRANITHHALPP